MKTFVVIQGGGIAGQVLQRELSLRNIASSIEDRASFPRDKVCGGVLQAESWDYLKTIFKLNAPFRKIGRISHFWGKIKILSLNLSEEMVFMPRLILDEALHLENKSQSLYNPEKIVTVKATGAEDAAGEWIGFQTAHPAVDEMRMYYGRQFFLGITPALGTDAHAAFIVKRDFFKGPDDLRQKIRRETGVFLDSPLKGTGRIRYGILSPGLAVGDAKLTTHPFLGLGMKHAIQSSRLLAELLAEGREADYDRLHRKLFKKYARTSVAAHRLLGSPFRALSLPLLGTPTLFKKTYAWLHR